MKTLKDMEPFLDDDLISKEQLKQTTIEWVKEFNKYENPIAHLGDSEDWIKHFFNLTEEDFK